MRRKGPTINDYALAWLRIALGVLFLIFAQYKLWGPAFIRGGFASSMHQFLRHGAYPFMLPILRHFVLPHATAIAYLVAYGELCIGLSLLLGILTAEASFFGLIYMVTILFSSTYPGPHAYFWQYFASAMNPLVPALCFVAFGMGDSTRVWSIRSYFRRKMRQMAHQATEGEDSSVSASNVFGK